MGFLLLGGVYICVVSIQIHLHAPKSSGTPLTPSQVVLLGSVWCLQAKSHASQSFLSVKVQQEAIVNWIYFEFLLLPFAKKTA